MKGTNHKLRLALILLIAACGGGESGPGPLKYTLDEIKIASVPPESKGSVLTAKQDLDAGQMEHDKAVSDLDGQRTKVEVAKNEAAQAQLAQSSAETTKNAAAKTANMTDVSDADKALHNAQLGRKAADAKYQYERARYEYMKEVVRWNEFMLAAKGAKWQLEKAQIAQRNNIHPDGFVEDNFERQYRERTDQADRARKHLDSALNATRDRKNDWQAKQQAYDLARGVAPSVEGGSMEEPPKPY